jgi:ribose/xylose/arabinose/galactoside ABC-type transport system permease subunit
MEQSFIDIAAGSFLGFAIALACMLFTNDGVWPTIWAVLIMAGATLGTLVGVYRWLF